MPEPQPPQPTITELLNSYRGQAIHLGTLTAQRKPPKVLGAAVGKLNQIERQLWTALGLAGAQSPEVTNRASFIWLAQQRLRARCKRCDCKPVRGAGLNLWTRDTVIMPLPLVLAHSNCGLDKVKMVSRYCDFLCRKCARTKGGRLLVNGQPDLKSYGVEATC